MIDMNYDAATNTLVLETTNCVCTYGPEAGKRAGTKPCPTCKGTGRGPRGKVRGCQSCHGYKTAPDLDNLVTCKICDGTAIVPEDVYSRAKGEITNVITGLPIVVRRLNRRNDFNESYMGLGVLYSSTDYGDAAKGDNETLIAKVRESLGDGHHQAINFVRSKADLSLVDTIMIQVTANGYSVKGVFISDLRRQVLGA